MKHEVFWKNPGYVVRPELKENIACDYLIVGGGITGVSLAYFLSEYSNKKIVLIERRTIGSGATGRSAGILTVRGELDLTQIFKLFGRKKGLEYWKINHEGLRLIKDIVEKEKIQCEFELQDTLFGCMHGGDSTYVINEYNAEKKIEKNTRLLSDEDIKNELNTSVFKHIVISKNHAISVNPLKHVQQLSYVIQGKGVEVYEDTNLTRYKENTAKTHHGTITFKKMILATDIYHHTGEINNRVSTIAITKKISPEQLREIGLHKKKILWDSEEEYHYLKITHDNRIMLGFGDKIVKKKFRKIPLGHSHLKEIITFLTVMFPQLNIAIDYAWSGIFGTTATLTPYIKIGGNIIKIGGAGSQIMCVMAAKHVAQLLTGKKSTLTNFFKV